MTIDEAITHARESAKNERKIFDKCNPKNNYACKLCIKTRTCLERAEEHEQLAEWLEELVMLRLDSCMIHMPERLHLVENGYNKAIDDFAEKLNTKCDGMIKDKWNSNVAPISWAEAYADFKDDIDEIAEQLKAGGENDK